MINAYQKKILILAIYAGEIMMKNGPRYTESRIR